MVSVSVLMAAVSSATVLANKEAVSLLQTSSHKVVHAHNRSATPYPQDSTWPEGYKIATSDDVDVGKVFNDNTQFTLCSKGFTPGSCYQSGIQRRGKTVWGPRGMSASQCLDWVKNKDDCQGDYVAMNLETGLGECWCVVECTHNDYFSFSDYGQGASPSVTCMMDKVPYADVPKKWEMFGGDKKVKFMGNALQGNCDKNQWVLGTSVSKDGTFQGYVNVGQKQGGGHEEVFYKTPSECLAAAKEDERCNRENMAVNFHFADESQYGYDTTGELIGPVGKDKGNYQEAQCFCTGPQGPPMFTRKNWVHILSCMTGAPVLDEAEEPGPKPDKATCKAVRERVKAARTARKSLRAEIKALREQLKAKKAALKDQKAIIAQDKAAFKACKR